MGSFDRETIMLGIILFLNYCQYNIELDQYPGIYAKIKFS